MAIAQYVSNLRQLLKPISNIYATNIILNKQRISQMNSSTNTPAHYTIDTKNQQQPLQKSEWNIIYRLPLVRWASAFNRLKIYQGGLTVAGIPAAFMLEQANICASGSGVVVTAVGISGLMTLSLCSLAVQNLIGFIYINEKADQLKFAIVDYWGHRRDILVDVADLVPDGAQDKPTRFGYLQKIGTLSNEKVKLKLLQRHGIIVEPTLFQSLFY